MTRSFGMLLIGAWLLLVSLLLPLQSVLAQENSGAASRPIPIRSISEVIEGWSPNKQLFVRGSVGVGEPQLQELAVWLQRNSPHWLVVLIDDAARETYSTPTHRYNGVDAVEVLLGNRLSNETDFGKLQHPLTGEADGAVIVMMIKQRRISYFASDAQDNRNLGEANWVGNLDQPAIRAMKAGGRVVDAVKNTVQMINQRLANSIQLEKNQEIAAAQAREREFNLFQTSLKSIEEQVQEVQTHRDLFRTQHPNAQGPLSNPPISNWETRIGSLRSGATLENARSRRPDLDSVRTEIEDYLHGYVSVEGLEERIAQLTAPVARLRESNDPSILPTLSAIEREIIEARNAAQEGRFEVDQHIATIGTLVQEGTESLDRSIYVQELTASIWKWVIRITLGIVAAILAAFAWLLSIFRKRRNEIKAKAEKELAIREESIQLESNQINQLFTRTTDILGSRDRIEKRGYEGITKEVALQVLDNVDRLLILAREMRRVLDIARNTIHPTSLWARLRNSFSGESYAEGMALLNGRPLKFNEAHGLPRIFREQRNERLPANSEGDVEISFEQAFEVFHDLGRTTKGLLDRLEVALPGAQDLLTQSQDQLAALASQDHDLADTTSTGIDWSLDVFLDNVVPQISEKIQEAEAKGLFDAIDVYEEKLPRVQTLLTSVRQLIDRLATAKNELYPRAIEHSSALTALGFDTGWIQEEFQKIVQRYDRDLSPYTGSAVWSDSFRDALAKEGDFEELTGRVERLGTIANRLHTEIDSRVEALRQQNREAKQEIANQLNLAIDQIQFGKEVSTTERLAQAASDFGLAKKLIVKGDAAAAESVVAQGIGKLDRVAESIAIGKSISTQFPTKARKLSEQVRGQTDRWKKERDELQRVQTRFDARSLRFRIPEESKLELARARNLDDVLAIAERKLSQGTKLIEEGDTHFRAGKLILASEALQRGEEVYEEGAGAMNFMDEFVVQLEKQVEWNEKKHSELVKWLEVLESTQTDAQASRSTLEAMQSATRAARRSLNEGVHTTPLNPVERAKGLEEIEDRLRHLQAKIVADRQAYAEAARAVQGAKGQWDVAWGLVQRSQQDGIPDSRATTKSNERIGALRSEVDRLGKSIGEAHGDWKRLDQEAYRLQSNIDSVAKQLASELQDAERVYQVFQAASQEVFNAENWIGKYGARVAVHDGIHAIERARRALQHGEYRQVLEHSQSASELAQIAIKNAERNEKRLEMERRAKEEKRRRNRRPPSSPFGGGSGGGFWPTVIIGGDWGSSSSSSDSWFGGGGGGGWSGGGSWGGGGSSWGGGGGNGSGFSGSNW